MKKKNNLKLQIVLLSAILLCLIGLIVIAVFGLKIGLVYGNSKTINVNLGIEFNNNDIKELAKEVYGENAEIIVRKVEVYNDMVSVTLKDSTDEQTQMLVDKINSCYNLSKSIDEDVTIIENSNIRLRSLINHYISWITLSMCLVIIYISIIYRRNRDVISIVLGSTIKLIAGPFVLLAIYAIFRVPVNRLSMSILLTLYSLTVYFILCTKQEPRKVKKGSGK